MRLSAPIYQLKREARLLARKEAIPLHEAQDRIARGEGFTTWSLLSARLATRARGALLLRGLEDGDMLLIGAPPGHGKTRLGLQLLLAAAHEGRRAVFFTLEHTEQEAMDRIRSLSDTVREETPEIVTSDEISADFVVRHLWGSPRGTVAVIDYLQLLDQQRSKPSLSDQMKAFQAFARSTGVILGFISQIDRSFDPERKPVPSLVDIRLPNPVPKRTFSKACFLHASEARLNTLDEALDGALPLCRRVPGHPLRRGRR